MRNPIQLDMFSVVTLNVGRAFKSAMADDLKNSGLSREQLVDKMNDLADRHGVCLSNGTRLTMEILEKWLNPTDMTRIMPVKALPVFCAATGYYSAACVVVEPLGLRVIGPREQKMLKWAEAKMSVRDHNRVIRKLEDEL